MVGWPAVVLFVCIDLVSFQILKGVRCILWLSVGSKTGLHPVLVTGDYEWCINNQRTLQGMHAVLSMLNSSSCVF